MSTAPFAAGEPARAPEGTGEGRAERVVARFQAERQSLAVMEHPSIATILDAGTTDDGRPYFVMELVRGTDLLRYADERRLGVRERVAMMIQVCHGVQHAHRKGVIHRDLKLSNIIVTESGEGPIPKIIDFGIAKVVDPDGLEGDRLTRADESTGTPAYMSPEQMGLLDQDVDTRTDVFSLGVILYQLLVGALPFDDSAYRGWATPITSTAASPRRKRRSGSTWPSRSGWWRSTTRISTGCRNSATRTATWGPCTRPGAT